ncbi:phenylalanine--tRNA ligase subunit beta [Candidatus Gracilibacteria bacterium]|nr:phenylalanine--tRNA ligase subunit beta [Candidatus Gracilibacteria bacterium]
MKLSLNWLSELVDLKGITPKEIMQKLTLHTAEVEGFERQKPFFEKVYAGKFLDVKPHPESKKLFVGQFDLGSLGKKKIIFGTVHELHKGEIYPIVTEGAKLKSGIEIKKTEIKGVVSEGMVADNPELGMKNTGLMRFTDNKLIGKSLPEICPEFGDVILDIDNKSLTHRPDLWGHFGMARELSAIFNRKLNLPEPKVKLPTSGKKVNVQVKSDICLRHCFLHMSGIKVEPSPLPTQVRLENLDVRAISNMVDITNLLLLGMGQPMHVFDASRVEGDIVVRPAKKGEKITALDGEEYELNPLDTVVADEKKALSIAGIMGGEFSGVTKSTTDVIWECANWEATAIRKTSSRLGLRSDSSIRYEKSLDPEMCDTALLLAATHTPELPSSAKISGPLTDARIGKVKDISITLDPDYVRTHSGLDLNLAEMKEKLQSIGFEVKEKNKKLEVKVPSWRASKDVSIAEDLIEEIVRLYGFENIPATLPALPINPPQTNWLRRLEWQMRDFWKERNYMEVFNYSFVNSEDADFTGDKNYVLVENPLSEEQAMLRTTLISNIVRHIESELRTHSKLNFFEIGKTYKRTTDVLPEEVLHLTIMLSETFNKKSGDLENEKFFALKSDLVQLFHSLNLTAEFRPATNLPPYANPAKAAEIFVNNEHLGLIAALHPTKHPVRNSVFVFAEINMEKLLEQSRNVERKYQKISPFPPIFRDVSIVVNKKTLMGEIEAEMKKASPALRRTEFFDEFEDNQKFGKELKNIAFHLEFSSKEKTFTEEEIDQSLNKILKALGQKFNAKLRLEFDNKS